MSFCLSELSSLSNESLRHSSRAGAVSDVLLSLLLMLSLLLGARFPCEVAGGNFTCIIKLSGIFHFFKSSIHADSDFM